MHRESWLGLGLGVLLVGCSSSSSPSGAGGAVDAGGGATHDSGHPPSHDANHSDGTGGNHDAGRPPSHDAGSPNNDARGRHTGEDASSDAGGCGEFTGDHQPTCSGDGNSLGDCVDGSADIQDCQYGCLYGQDGGAASCQLEHETNFSCTGDYGTIPVNDGNYYISEFGCYVADGGVQTDPDDNCIPACLQQAQQAGLCDPNGTGPDCEEAINWYTADGARFGCLARLRVTNPSTGQSVIALALDYGPGCGGENDVDHAVLDSSGPVNDYLFGGPSGASERMVVHVVQVDDSYPLGPE
jgi:hypothetical protein